MTTVNEQLIEKLALKDGITKAAAAQKLEMLERHATEFRELTTWEPTAKEAKTAEPKKGK